MTIICSMLSIDFSLSDNLSISLGLGGIIDMLELIQGSMVEAGNTGGKQDTITWTIVFRIK